MRIFLAILFAAGTVAVFAKTDTATALHVVYAKATIVEVVDSDGDGLADASERAIGSDVSAADTDGDGLWDGDEEIMLNTSAVLQDCDGDGFGDGLEVAAGADPRRKESVPVCVSGTVVNPTPFPGPVFAELFASNVFEAVTNNATKSQVCRKFSSPTCPAEFCLENAIAVGMPFRIEAWADVNTNGVMDAWEPSGVFVSRGAVAEEVGGIEIVLECNGAEDTDGNGLADSWEWMHFGSLGNPADGDPDKDGLDNAEENEWWTDPFDDDSDNDGMADGDEVMVGFDPSVADERPRLRLMRADNGMFRLEWNTRYCQGYVPQYTEKLDRPAWSNLVPHTLYEFGAYPYGTMSVIDVNTNSPSRFYRIKLVK